MKSLYRFDNGQSSDVATFKIEKDFTLVQFDEEKDDRKKVSTIDVHRIIAVVASSELEARTMASRGKLNETTLSDEYRLVLVSTLSKDWQ